VLDLEKVISAWTDCSSNSWYSWRIFYNPGGTSVYRVYRVARVFSDFLFLRTMAKQEQMASRSPLRYCRANSRCSFTALYLPPRGASIPL
jgi:hypothetical protein